MGYLDPMPVERVRAARRQVLVVVTASWQVGEAGEATRCRVVNVEVVLGVCQCHYHVLLLVAMQLGAWMRFFLNPGGLLLGFARILSSAPPTAFVQILCFDHNLKLMWEQDIRIKMPHHSHIKEVRFCGTCAQSDIASCTLP